MTENPKQWEWDALIVKSIQLVVFALIPVMIFTAINMIILILILKELRK